jgi:uncharacterized protein YbaP (TraB family)
MNWRHALIASLAALLMAPAFAVVNPPAAPRAAAPAPAACPPPPAPPDAAELQALRQRARDRGVMWTISKDGHTSYLYGTLHVGRRDWLAPGPALQQALADTDVLALELDPTDPATAREMAQTLADWPAITLTPALQRRLARQRSLACADGVALDRLPVLMQAVTLSLLSVRRDGLEAAYGQEMLLAGWAKAMGKPVASLETVALQLDLLAPGNEAEALALVTQSLRALEDGSARPVLRRTAQVWAAGRLDELARYPQWCDCIDGPAERALLERLNDARNPGMADRIDAHHHAGERVLAAVGALHMVGLKGLPALLAARGYTVERVRFAP